MHRVYSKYAEENGKRPVCRKIFSDILKDKKVSIHKPRKDQCDLCCSNAVGHVMQEEYEEHILKKNEAHMAKEAAKSQCDQKTVVVTMDVQSVLLAPNLMASAIYYKRKIQMHNLTFFRLNDGDVQLYVWDESQGGVSCNEFTSCIVDYISMLPAEVSRVILISDGCAYQNRNKVLSSALRDLSRSNNKIIEQLILERGHTMMEADAVHAQLGRFFKSAIIYAPSDYIILMRQARPEQPYHVKELNYTFFNNFEDVPTNVSTIRPGIATVNEIRGLKYDNGEIAYKLRHPDDWCILHKRALPTRGVARVLSRLSPLHSSSPKISKSKYNDLQVLKALLPREYHNFYDSLLHD